MKRKLKLAFEQLESELSVISHDELFSILGGYDYSSGISDSNMESLVNYFTSLGMQISEDANGYYLTGGSIRLNTVDVFGYRSGYIDNSLGWEQFKDDFIAYVSGFGHHFTMNDTGGGGYSYDGYNAPNDGDPWNRLENGKIKAEPTTSVKFIYNDYGNNMLMQEVELYAGDQKVKAYKVISVLDPVTGERRPPLSNEMSNCLGYAIADGDYWILDNPTTPSVDEGNLSSIINTLYTPQTSKDSDSHIVAIYDESGDIVHAGIYDPSSGTYSAKGGINSEVYNITSEENFKRPYGPNGFYYWGPGYSIKYFK